MTNKLKPDEKVFANEYLKTGKKQASALKARPHLNKNSASVHANRLLKNAKIQAYIDDYAIEAINNIKDLANNAMNENVKLRANQDILDRSGYVAPNKSNSKMISNNDDNNSSKEDATLLLEALQNGDNIELQRILFTASDAE